MMMNKSIEEQILDYITGQLKDEELKIFEANLKSNRELKDEVEKVQSGLEIFENYVNIEIPDPSPSMDERFYRMLNKEKSKQPVNKNGLMSLLQKLTTVEFLKPALYGATMMFMGVLIGNYYTPKQIDITNTSNRLVSSKYLEKIHELAVVSMLQLPSVSKRLQAVSLVESSKTIDDVIITALFDTLNNDTNLNVRLIVLDTLAQFSNTADVRARLVNSITQQKSPMVQFAIADLMINLQETKAIKPLKKLLDNKDLIEPVREKIIYAVNELI